jgi:hypothetical protein
MLLIASVAGIAVADEQAIVSFDDMDVGELESESFRVLSTSRVHIYAIGAGKRTSTDLSAYGWVLDDRTREPVWIMTYENSESIRNKGFLVEFDDDVMLKPGSYTAYYYPGGAFGYSGDVEVESFGELFDMIGDALSNIGKQAEDYEFTITAPGEAVTDSDSPDKFGGWVVCQLLADEDDFYGSSGFSIERQTSLDVYAEGEYSAMDKVMVDYGWIINADTRESVWAMERWNTEPAGGAQKNRVFRDEVVFAPGNYVMFFSTDDSHSPEGWNLPPPHDPDMWGISVLAKDQSDASKVKPYKDDDVRLPQTLIEIIRVKDDEMIAKYFKLKMPMTLHVYAIGEYDTYGDVFADYGWIEESKTGERVWEMERRNTEHAGGHSKNRKFDGIVKLDAGDYAVYYVTDGSHAYGSWNASPPADQRNYGITISGAGSSFDKSQLVVSDQPAIEGGAFVSFLRIGDDEEKSKAFSLDSQSKVRISALGEGKDGEMYDYGWIEDSRTGDIVWEMTYRKTRHAGGASKNRSVDDVILLDRGAYTAYYVTDDSHAFNDWNSEPPSDPTHWGMTVTLVK